MTGTSVAKPTCRPAARAFLKDSTRRLPMLRLRSRSVAGTSGLFGTTSEM
jgi:hypothetical protein